MNFPMLFTKYVSILQSHKRQLQYFQFDLENLNEIKKSLVHTKDSYAYNFSHIRIVVPKKHRPSHCIPRTLTSDIEILLSIEDDVVIKRTRNSLVEDPLIKLEKFNIILNSEKYTSSWHLDRHEKKDGESTPASLHPVYHLTFGGHHMENQQKDDGDEFGRALIVRTPRIMHPPMELLLGLDFIFSHFIPKDQLDLLSDKAYLKIIQDLKKGIWLPFALALAKNYCDSIDIDGDRFEFDQGFVSSILSV